MIKRIFIILIISCLESCTSISHIPLPTNFNFTPKEEPSLTSEEHHYFEMLTEKRSEEISACQFLGTTTGEGGGGLAGKWRAKKMVKYEAAKHKADTVVFGPDPSWEISKTIFYGSFYNCNGTSPMR